MDHRNLPHPDGASPHNIEPLQRLKAVFFSHMSVTTGPMIEAWLHAGHQIGAIVVNRQKRRTFLSNPVRWLALEKALMRHVRRHRIPVIELAPPLDWEALGQTLSAGAPDIAITYGFMRLIPDALLDRFPRGGVNFHPALLPHYRGPQPLHWLAIDGTWDRFGGVTLHEMTGGFDEGAILAQAPISFQLGRREVTPREFATSAVARMTRDVIPHYCANGIRAWPQPSGVYPYASYGFPDLVVEPGWTRDYLKRLCMVMTKRPGVSIDISGRKFRLLGEARVLGPPNGKPATRRWGRIEFDLADRRVSYRRHTALNKRLAYFWNALREFDTSTQDVEVLLGPFEEPSGDPPNHGTAN